MIIAGLDLDIEFTQEQKNFAEINQMYEKLAVKKTEEFKVGFDERYTDMSYMLDGIDTFFHNFILKEVIECSIKYLQARGVYTVDETVFKKYMDEMGPLNHYWYPACEQLREKYNTIMAINQEEHDYRELRKDARGRVIGGGFGVEGAIKGMVTAEAMNLAIGAVHSAVNAVGNSQSNSRMKKASDELLAKSKEPLSGAVMESVHNMQFVVIYICQKENIAFFAIPSREDEERANAMLNSLKSCDIPLEQERNIVAEIFSLNPACEGIYRYLIDKYGDKYNTLSILAKEMNINSVDKLKKVKIEQYLRECGNIPYAEFKGYYNEFLAQIDKSGYGLEDESDRKIAFKYIQSFVENYTESCRLNSVEDAKGYIGFLLDTYEKLEQSADEQIAKVKDRFFSCYIFESDEKLSKDIQEFTKVCDSMELDYKQNLQELFKAYVQEEDFTSGATLEDKLNLLNGFEKDYGLELQPCYEKLVKKGLNYKNCYSIEELKEVLVSIKGIKENCKLELSALEKEAVESFLKRMAIDRSENPKEDLNDVMAICKEYGCDCSDKIDISIIALLKKLEFNDLGEIQKLLDMLCELEREYGNALSKYIQALNVVYDKQIEISRTCNGHCYETVEDAKKAMEEKERFISILESLDYTDDEKVMNAQSVIKSEFTMQSKDVFVDFIDALVNEWDVAYRTVCGKVYPTREIADQIKEKISMINANIKKVKSRQEQKLLSDTIELLQETDLEENYKENCLIYCKERVTFFDEITELSKRDMPIDRAEQVAYIDEIRLAMKKMQMLGLEDKALTELQKSLLQQVCTVCGKEYNTTGQANSAYIQALKHAYDYLNDVKNKDANTEKKGFFAKIASGAMSVLSKGYEGDYNYITQNETLPLPALERYTEEWNQSVQKSYTEKCAEIESGFKPRTIAIFLDYKLKMRRVDLSEVIVDEPLLSNQEIQEIFAKNGVELNLENRQVAQNKDAKKSEMKTEKSNEDATIVEEKKKDEPRSKFAEAMEELDEMKELGVISEKEYYVKMKEAYEKHGNK